jgi:hypothetical protein
MDWETWQRAVELDGSSLWDVYVLGTDRSDWQGLLDWLHESRIPLSFERGGVSEAAPLDVGDAFAQQEYQDTCTMFIDPAGMRVNTHFFIEEEIELDIDPRDVRGGHDLARLQAFLTRIAGLLGKTVLITPENGQDTPWFEIAPEGPTQPHLAWRER